jgi:hypothetical protein
MKPLWVDKSTPATGFAALLFALFLGYAGSAAAQCTSVPCMTIKIYNNSDTYNIYPVLSSGTAVGAINQNKDPFGLDVHNVDYDVSYVDTAFMPVAMDLLGSVVWLQLRQDASQARGADQGVDAAVGQLY